MLDRNEIRKIDAKVVSEISWKIAIFMRRIAPADPQLNFVLVYLAYVAVTNEIDNIDDLIQILCFHISIIQRNPERPEERNTCLVPAKHTFQFKGKVRVPAFDRIKDFG